MECTNLSRNETYSMAGGVVSVAGTRAGLSRIVDYFWPVGKKNIKALSFLLKHVKKNTYSHFRNWTGFTLAANHSDNLTFPRQFKWIPSLEKKSRAGADSLPTACRN